MSSRSRCSMHKAGSIFISEEDLNTVKTSMLPPKIPCANKVFPDFSISLNLAYKKEVGRHVVATRNIRAGEIVAVEDSAISFLNFDERGSSQFGSICTNCFVRNLDCLPSPLTNSVSIQISIQI